MADESTKSKQDAPELTDEHLEEVAGGKFKFFRPNPSGDGTTEQFYTVEITEGRTAQQPGQDLTTSLPEDKS